MLEWFGLFLHLLFEVGAAPLFRPSLDVGTEGYYAFDDLDLAVLVLLRCH